MTLLLALSAIEPLPSSTGLEWVQQLGFPTAALVGIGLFVWKLLWPFLTNLIEVTSKQRDAELDRYMTSLDRRDAQADLMIQAMQGLTQEIRLMRAENGFGPDASGTARRRRKGKGVSAIK